MWFGAFCSSFQPRGLASVTFTLRAEKTEENRSKLSVISKAGLILVKREEKYNLNMISW